MGLKKETWDVRWTRRHLAVLAIACVLGGGLLTRHAAGRMEAGEPLAYHPDRIAAATERIDPNTASAASLRRLRGIGPKMAERIIAHRQARPAPAFRSAKDLAAVHGIGPKTIAAIRPHLQFSASDNN